jgi:hypothetical protein
MGDVRRLILLVILIFTGGCDARDPTPVVQSDAKPAEGLPPDHPANAPIEEKDIPAARPMTNEDLNRIERELEIKLPSHYGQFMVARSQELLGHTYPLRGQTELWFDSEFFGFSIDRLLSENIGQRRPDMAAGAGFPSWWKEYFFFGTNGGGDYYALRLDGTPTVYFVACDAGTIKPYIGSLEEYVTQSLNRYPAELAVYQKLEELYQRKLRGEITEADFDKQWQETVAASVADQ